MVLAFGGGGYGERAYNGGLGAVPPAGSRGRGAEPLVRGSGGLRPQKLNTTIHFISQFSPNFVVTLVYDIQYNEHHTTKVSLTHKNWTQLQRKQRN